MLQDIKGNRAINTKLYKQNIEKNMKIKQNYEIKVKDKKLSCPIPKK